MWIQTTFDLRPQPRGFHLAPLTINENADPAVRADFERWVRQAVPDDAPYFRHVTEGRDDMRAHVKSSLFGCALTIPIRQGELALGTWQGIWLCEHRERGGARSVIATLQDEPRR